MAANVIFETQTISGFTADPALGYHTIQDGIIPPFTVGEMYYVIWDGNTFSVTAFAVEWPGLGNFVAVGDGSPLSDLGDFPGNGEPFLILTSPNTTAISAFTDPAEEHSVGVYQSTEDPGEPEEPDEPEAPKEGIVLKDRNGNDVAYYGIETVTFDTTTEGKQQTFTKGVAVEGLEIVPDFSGGDMPVNAPAGALVKSAVIRKPADLSANNVRAGKTIAGFIGELVPAPDNPYIEYTLNEVGEIIAAKMYGFTTIPTGCFRSMAYLETVDLTNSPGVVAIGDYAFGNCTALANFAIPGTVTTVGNNAFNGCTALTSVGIPDSVTSIGQYAFANCNGITNIVIPDNVTDLGNYAFYQCKGLINVTIGAGVKNIGNYTFGGCSALPSVEIPNTVVSISNQAFYQCTALTSVDIPDSVTSIGNGVFQYCSALTNVTIGNGLKIINSNVFHSCGITSITIPDSITDINTGAFAVCSKMTSVTIGSGVTYIGSNAFMSCDALNYVKFKTASGWWVSTSSTATSGTNLSSSTLANTSTAATYLKSTYRTYYWKRN